MAEAWQVAGRLREFDIEVAMLREAIVVGARAASGCTALHPSSYPGTMMWAETIAAAAAESSAHWRYVEESGQSLLVNANKAISFTVAGGDGRTGLEGPAPRTRNPKGSAMLTRVERNQQRSLFEVHADSVLIPTPSAELRDTWLLLVSAPGAVIRAEFSKPSAIDASGHVYRYDERLLIGSIDLDAADVDGVRSDDEPPVIFDVNVTRRS